MRLLLFLALLALALVAQTPAWFAARQVSDASTQLVELRNASGTLWNGRGDVIVRGANGREVNAGPVLWKLRRFDVDRKVWVVELAQMPPALASRPLNATISAGFDRVNIAGAIRVTPDIAGALPMLGGWTLSGDPVADLTPVEATRRGITGNTALQWQRARLTPPDFPAGFDLGDVSGTLTLTDAGGNFRLRNSGGDVEVTIEGSSAARTITLLVQPRATASPAQLGWLRSHTMSRTPAGGFRIDAGWP